MKRTKPGIEEPIKTPEEKTAAVMDAFMKMTEMFTNIVGTQRETLKLISSLGKMLEITNKQVDMLTRVVLEKDKIQLK